MLKRIVLGRLPVFDELLAKAEDRSLAIVELGSAGRVRAQGKRASPQQLILRAHTRRWFERAGIRGSGVFKPVPKAQNKLPRGEWSRSRRF